jgi:hypothetical protein
MIGGVGEAGSALEAGAQALSLMRIAKPGATAVSPREP